MKYVLAEFNMSDIPIGSFNYDHPKNCLSPWYIKQFPEFRPSLTSERPKEGASVLFRISDETTTIITGGPLNNLAKALEEHPDFKAEKFVIQGGFSGEGVIPREKQLEKFKGQDTCHSWNLTGNIPAAKKVIGHDETPKYFVSKNVCHSVTYTSEFHHQLEDGQEHPNSIKKIHAIMENYLIKHRDGKILHDPLAACCAIEPEIGSWEKVTLSLKSKKAGWGSTKTETGNTWIITDYNPQRFLQTFNYI